MKNVPAILFIVSAIAFFVGREFTAGMMALNCSMLSNILSSLRK